MEMIGLPNNKFTMMIRGINLDNDQLHIVSYIVTLSGERRRSSRRRVNIKVNFALLKMF
jgi:hypothetical protein